MLLERDMIPPIKKLLATRWKGRGVVFEEFGVGYGVADVVAARLNKAAISRRLRMGQNGALTSRAAVQLLLAMEPGPISEPELLEATGLSRKRFRGELLPLLIDTKFAVADARGALRLAAPYAPVTNETWAIEAKIKNWFEGVCQARRYQHFAHRVYLAIPASNRRMVRERTLQALNVGLIAVTSERARVVFHPRFQSPRTKDLSTLSAERIWHLTSSEWCH